jgi:hypothetical protein
VGPTARQVVSQLGDEPAKVALSRLKDTIKPAKDTMKNAVGLGGGSGGAKKLKMTNIVERLDVGLPLRTTTTPGHS